MHFNFLDKTTALATALQGIYDPVLVILSLVITSIASYSAFILTKKMGIWAMHYIGMSGVIMNAVILYDPGLLILGKT